MERGFGVGKSYQREVDNARIEKLQHKNGIMLAVVVVAPQMDFLVAQDFIRKMVRVGGSDEHIALRILAAYESMVRFEDWSALFKGQSKNSDTRKLVLIERTICCKDRVTLREKYKNESELSAQSQKPPKLLFIGLGLEPSSTFGGLGSLFFSGSVLCYTVFNNSYYVAANVLATWVIWKTFGRLCNCYYVTVADGKEANRLMKIWKNSKQSAKPIAEEDSASRVLGTRSASVPPTVEPDPPITLPTNWEEEDDGLSAAILVRDFDSVCDLYNGYVKYFDKDSPMLYKILKSFDCEANVLLRRLPNPPAIDDDDKELSPLFPLAVTGMLPEKCVWYTERFGKDDIPFEQWVNEYRIEQDGKSVEEKRLHNNFAKNWSVNPGTMGKSDAVNEDLGEDACGAYPTQPEASLPAHFATKGDTVPLVDYPSSDCDDPEPLQNQLVLGRKKVLQSNRNRNSLRGRRLSKRVDVEAAQTDTEDSLDGEDYIDNNGNGHGSNGAGNNSDSDNTKDREESNRSHGGRGPLPREAKAHLDALMAKLEEDVKAIAQEFGKPPEMCFKYIDGVDGSLTHSVTYWNIWQQWYGVHGQRKKLQNMPVSEWTGVVHNKLEIFLRSKLSDKDFDKTKACERALEEQTSWFWEHHDALIGETIARGKGNAMVTKILRPIVQMTLQKVKATNGTQMLSQADNIGLQIVVAKVVECKVDSKLAELYRHCIAKKESRDRHRSMIPRIFTYDLNRIFEEGDVPKLNFANFCGVGVETSTGVPFLHIGVRTKKRFVTGVSALNKYKASDLTKICGLHMEQIQQAVNGEEVDEDLHCFEIERWTDEEETLSKDRWSTIQVVSDTMNNTIVSVPHSSSYYKEGSTAKDAMSLFARDSDDDDMLGGRIDSHPSRKSSEQGRLALAEPLKSRAGRPVNLVLLTLVIPTLVIPGLGNAASSNVDSGNTDSGNTRYGNTRFGNTRIGSTNPGNTNLGYYEELVFSTFEFVF
ncbi:hypothetical protein BDP27DRAFT_1410589 [Rhodocollybia butyracea]|uniref:Uncharacterized protein n=1 Tax=Rhodocollybia butyracea TaxID=206335 RepID=A0A9P5TUU0_9AGAR|nr:hypothetical protein BDP27DRAFT_1410589 [Rhodocollybia butyracea]